MIPYLCSIHVHPGGVAELKPEFGGGVFKFGLDMAVIEDGKAETEGGATLEACKLDLGPEHSRELDLCMVASKTTDSAPTAIASSGHVSYGKDRAFAAKTETEKVAMTPRQLQLAKSKLKKRRCQNHVWSFLCNHFIGQRTKKDKDKKVRAFHIIHPPCRLLLPPTRLFLPLRLGKIRTR